MAQEVEVNTIELDRDIPKAELEPTYPPDSTVYDFISGRNVRVAAEKEATPVLDPIRVVDPDTGSGLGWAGAGLSAAILAIALILKNRSNEDLIWGKHVKELTP